MPFDPHNTGLGEVPWPIRRQFMIDLRKTVGRNKAASMLNLNPQRLENYLRGVIVMPPDVQQELRIFLNRELKKKQKKEREKRKEKEKNAKSQKD